MVAVGVGNMARHDIIVIGTSAGGLKALSAVLSEIPPGIGAAIFVIQQTGSRHEELSAEPARRHHRSTGQLSG
ncbi:MAG: hypothetical protein DMF56_27745 [Acidobacteria bacterium]|nr:MAG: hypothetical protein DMF56_27745 [Acidobacteriota bacterium]